MRNEAELIEALSSDIATLTRLFSNFARKYQETMKKTVSDMQELRMMKKIEYATTENDSESVRNAQEGGEGACDE